MWYITAERQYFMPTGGTYPPLLGGLQFRPGLQALAKICHKSQKKKHINNIVKGLNPGVVSKVG